MHAALSPYSAWQDYQTQWCILHYHTTTVYSKIKVVKSPSTIFFNKSISCSNSSSHFHILCLWKLPLKCCNMETIRWQVFLQEKSWKKRGAFTSSILCFPIGIIIPAPFPKLNLSRCLPVYPRQSKWKNKFGKRLFCNEEHQDEPIMDGPMDPSPAPGVSLAVLWLCCESTKCQGTGWWCLSHKGGCVT